MKKVLWAIIVLMLPVLFAGCIRTRLLVVSDPPDAKLTLNRKVYGQTPVDVMIGWYWYYDIKLEKKGFQDFETEERIRSRSWQTMPFDFFAEIIPFPFLDERTVYYRMTPIPAEQDLQALMEP